MPCRLSSPHLISPPLLVGLNNNNNNFNNISSRRISSFKLVRRRPLDCRARPSGEEEEGGLELERELLVFMKNNSSLEFPTRKQLLDAGRSDLVNAISNTRGWLTLGWDYEEEHDFTTTDHFTQNHHTSSLEDIMLLPQEQEEEDTGGGVHGILNRLEKHRSSSFDIHMQKDKTKKQASSSTTHVGAAKIDSQRRNKDLSTDNITTRLQHMQLELSSAIHSLRSKSNHTLNSDVHESCGNELQQLSDVWEFQENEVIKAGDKLRSLRAKLAVLQGKIALSVTDTHKLVEEKQRRIDSARATLQLLRTTCIFWSHAASEVLLVGSFDGWTSKVKMEKTKTGVFCASLKLYPGRYEIKFIVDGTWRVDPMLPVVHNNGYENNILVVHESA